MRVLYFTMANLIFDERYMISTNGAILSELNGTVVGEKILYDISDLHNVLEINKYIFEHLNRVPDVVQNIFGMNVLSKDSVVRQYDDINSQLLNNIQRHYIMPIIIDGIPAIAVINPFNVAAIDNMRMFYCGNMNVVMLSFEQWNDIFHSLYCNSTESSIEVVDKENIDCAESQTDDMNNTFGEMLDVILSDAIESRASDVHFENLRDCMRVRFRIDGILHVNKIVDGVVARGLVAQLKLITGASVDEVRLPQDRRACVTICDKKYDIRFSILPTVFGDNVALRIFNQESIDLNIDTIGLHGLQKDVLTAMVGNNNGLILVCGPTGCGKTTTLYALLKWLLSVDKKVITIEDPIEYRLDDVTQVAVREEIGLTFSSILRSVLRQAPNVIMVGEIRDADTASLAVQAALTGHLVFSTVHCSRAKDVIGRLLDFGVSEYLLRACLRGAIAQRLVRRSCSFCCCDINNRSQHSGCERCNFRGYNGRSGIFECFVQKKLIGSDGYSECSGIHDEYCTIGSFEEEVERMLNANEIFYDDAYNFL